MNNTFLHIDVGHNHTTWMKVIESSSINQFYDQLWLTHSNICHEDTYLFIYVIYVSLHVISSCIILNFHGKHFIDLTYLIFIILASERLH